MGEAEAREAARETCARCGGRGLILAGRLRLPGETETIGVVGRCPECFGTGVAADAHEVDDANDASAPIVSAITVTHEDGEMDVLYPQGEIDV